MSDSTSTWHSRFEQEVIDTLTTPWQNLSDEERHHRICKNHDIMAQDLPRRFKNRRTSITQMIVSLIYLLVFIKEMVFSNTFPVLNSAVSQIVQVTFDIPFVIIGLDLFTLILNRYDVTSWMTPYINIDRKNGRDVKRLNGDKGVPVVVWLNEGYTDETPTADHFPSAPAPVRRGSDFTEYCQHRPAILENTYIEQQERVAFFFKTRRLMFTLKMVAITFIMVLSLKCLFHRTDLLVVLRQSYDITLFVPHVIFLMDMAAQVAGNADMERSWIHKILDVDRVTYEEIPFVHERRGTPFLVWVKHRDRQE